MFKNSILHYKGYSRKKGLGGVGTQVKKDPPTHRIRIIFYPPPTEFEFVKNPPPTELELFTNLVNFTTFKSFLYAELQMGILLAGNIMDLSIGKISSFKIVSF